MNCEYCECYRKIYLNEINKLNRQNWMKVMRIKKLHKEKQLLEAFRQKEKESYRQIEIDLIKQNENKLNYTKQEKIKGLQEQLQVISDLKKKLQFLTSMPLDPKLQVHIQNPVVLKEVRDQQKIDIQSNEEKIIELQKKLKHIRLAQKRMERSHPTLLGNKNKPRFSFFQLTKKPTIIKEQVQMEVTRVIEEVTQEENYKKREYKIVSECQHQSLLKLRTNQELKNNRQDEEKTEEPEECIMETTEEKKRPPLSDKISGMFRNLSRTLTHVLKRKNKVNPL